MTISLAARSADGGFGLAVTSSSPAVAARCLYAEPGVGAASSQNVTDPRLGSGLIRLMSDGRSATEAIDEIVDHPDHTEGIEYRQLTAIGRSGTGAAFSGKESLGINAQRTGDGVVVAGNMLAATDLLDAAVEGFENATGELEERLLVGLRAAVDAGGEMGPVHSAGLLVVGAVEWPITNLRVDWADDDPIGELAALWGIWKPQRDTYVLRALDPADSPSYGVPGDE